MFWGCLVFLTESLNISSIHLFTFRASSSNPDGSDWFQGNFTLGLFYFDGIF